MNYEFAVMEDPNIGVDNPLFKRKVKILSSFRIDTSVFFQQS